MDRQRGTTAMLLTALTVLAVVAAPPGMAGPPQAGRSDGKQAAIKAVQELFGSVRGKPASRSTAFSIIGMLNTQQKVSPCVAESRMDSPTERQYSSYFDAVLTARTNEVKRVTHSVPV